MGVITNLKEKSNKGITLIALVITIIILLILAGISIAMLTGDNGILNKATTAGKETGKADIIEKAKLDILEIQTENENANITKEQLKEVLEKYFNNVPDPLPNDVSNLELIAKNQYGNHEIKVSDIWNVEFVVPEFNPETLEIGMPTNIDKYGWKVSNYTVQTSQMKSNIWRLFYQDKNYTYLITDEIIGSYKPSNYYSSYKEVGTLGKRLNLMSSSILTNMNAPNIKAVAWLTDTSQTSMWNEYKNNDAVFAIRKSNGRINGSIL